MSGFPSGAGKIIEKRIIGRSVDLNKTNISHQQFPWLFLAKVEILEKTDFTFQCECTFIAPNQDVNQHPIAPIVVDRVAGYSMIPFNSNGDGTYSANSPKSKTQVSEGKISPAKFVSLEETPVPSVSVDATSFICKMFNERIELWGKYAFAFRDELTALINKHRTDAVRNTEHRLSMEQAVKDAGEKYALALPRPHKNDDVVVTQLALIEEYWRKIEAMGPLQHGTLSKQDQIYLAEIHAKMGDVLHADQSEIREFLNLNWNGLKYTEEDVEKMKEVISKAVDKINQSLSGIMGKSVTMEGKYAGLPIVVEEDAPVLKKGDIEFGQPFGKPCMVRHSFDNGHCVKCGQKEFS